MKQLIAVLFTLTIPAFCADSGILPVLVKHLQTSKTYTVAVAEKMPDSDYGFKPNDAEMTFGQQAVHIAGANAFFLGFLTSEKSPVKKPEKLDKAGAIKMLNESFDYLIKVASGLTPEQLNKEYKTDEGNMTGTEALLLALDHTTHHRGQMIVYLRAKNIAPPEYKF